MFPNRTLRQGHRYLFINSKILIMQQERLQQDNFQQDPSPERQRKLEMAKEFFRKESFQLNGKEFDLYGVLHIPETIELHHKELENAIQKAGAVIVEIGPDITAL